MISISKKTLITLHEIPYDWLLESTAVLRSCYLSALFTLLLLMPPALSHATVQYLDLQSGSLMGMVHLSYGARFADHHSVQAGAGYVPKRSDHAEMTLYSIRYRYDSGIAWTIGNITLNPFSLGTGLLIGNHRELFVKLPERYPDGYYTPSALRLVFNYQATLNLNQHWQTYFDISILDVGLLGYVREPEFYYNNYDFLGLEGITNWGFGARYAF